MEIWKDLKNKLYPGDEGIKEKKKRNGEPYTVSFSNHEDYVNSKYFGITTDSKLHLGISPHPYAGNLERAKGNGQVYQNQQPSGNRTQRVQANWSVY